jgi:heme/copper-type cytochrome/quinol oxidase subunit 2
MVGREGTVKSKSFSSSAAILAVGFLLLVSPSSGRQEPQDTRARDPHSPTNRPQRVVSVLAKDFTFEPATIQMKVNEKIEVDVTGGGETLGIRVSPFPDGAKANTPPGLSFEFGEDCYKIRKGEMTPILIEATEPGTYSFSCCKNCGGKNKKMAGHIIVAPAP